MYRLNEALTGIVIDLNENDRQGVTEHFEGFQSLYRDNSRLVPEWADRYPDEPVKALGTAVEKGSPEEVMAAIGTVGAVCHSCHVSAMVAVQQRYHWPDFSTIAVPDPIRNADLPYPAFMQMLNASLTGIQVDLVEGQPDRAGKHLEDLVARMAALKESCQACHDTERAYYTDDRIDHLLSRMSEALATPGSDPGPVLELTRKLGEESCSRCHLVHLPAAYARTRQH